jgi:hypothetical protein
MSTIQSCARFVVLFAMIGVVSAGTAAAQTDDRGSVGLSYSYLRLLDDADFNVPAGWLVSFAKPVTRTPVSIVGEIAGNYRAESGEALRVHTFQGGVRVSGRSGLMRPFAQLLVGDMNVGCCGSSENAFALEPGGGMDIQLDRRVSLRLGASFPTAFYDGDTGHTFRFQTGVVIPVGR